MIRRLNEYLAHTDYIIHKVSKELGHTIVNKVGGGNYGMAYLTTDNKILKISYYKKDAIAADLLIGKNCEYLANCYNIYKTNDFDIIIMEKLDTENLKKKKLTKALYGFSEYLYSKKINYLLFLNSYFRDFIKIHKEAHKYNVRIDTQNIGNFGLKNGHLAAFDLSGKFDHWNYEYKNFEKIQELEKLYDEIKRNQSFDFL